jgi:hypothetical protein
VLLHALARACPSRAPPAVPVSFRGRNARARAPRLIKRGTSSTKACGGRRSRFGHVLLPGNRCPPGRYTEGEKGKGGCCRHCPGTAKRRRLGAAVNRGDKWCGAQAGQRGLLRPHQALSLLLKNTRNVEQWNGTPFSLHKKKGIMEWNGMPFFHFWRWWVPLPISFFSRAWVSGLGFGMDGGTPQEGHFRPCLPCQPFRDFLSFFMPDFSLYRVVVERGFGCHL